VIHQIKTMQKLRKQNMQFAILRHFCDYRYRHSFSFLF
jgi:hypothetical protein